MLQISNTLHVGTKSKPSNHWAIPATKHTKHKVQLCKMFQTKDTHRSTTLQTKTTNITHYVIHKIPRHCDAVIYARVHFHKKFVSNKQLLVVCRIRKESKVSTRSPILNKKAKPLTQLWCHTPEYRESESHSSCSRADFLFLERALRDRKSSPPLARMTRSFSPKRLMRNSVLPMPTPSRV
jgi:hypothetical protein